MNTREVSVLIDLLCFICWISLCKGFFGPYGPYSPFGHHDPRHKPHPFVVKHHKLDHIPHHGASVHVTQKHFINKTALCTLKGGNCTEPINCFGMQQFFCDSYETTCCFNRTKHVKFRKKHRLKDFINRTALCIAKGGVCSGAGTCIGSQQFSCVDQSETCCFNTSSKEVIIKKIIYPDKHQQRHKPRRQYPPLKKPHARDVKRFIFAHANAKSGPHKTRSRSYQTRRYRVTRRRPPPPSRERPRRRERIETIELYDYD